MKKYLVSLLLLIAPSVVSQRQNTFHVDQFPGADVGTKTTNAQSACNANTAIPCILIFDPTLAVYAQGTMPAKCAQCLWQDYRTTANTAPIVPQSVNGILNEETFTGADVSTRMALAITACGTTNPCEIHIPPNAPPGNSWYTLSSPIPANIVVKDFRGLNAVSIAYGGNPVVGLNSLLSVQNSNLPNDSAPFSGEFTLVVDSEAFGGGTPGNPCCAGSGALLAHSTRYAGSRPTWAFNPNFSYYNNNNTATGIEIDSGNNGTVDDPGDGTVGVGESILASGLKANGVALVIQNSGSPTARWQNGVFLSAYNNIGLRIDGSHSPATRQADILVIPATASYVNCALAVSGSNCAGALFAIHDDGSITTQRGINAQTSSSLNGIQVGGSVSAGTGMQHKRAMFTPPAAGAWVTVSIAWARAFADTNYTVTCSSVEVGNSTYAVTLNVNQKTATGVSVIVEGLTGTASGTTGTPELDCIAMHD